MGRRKWKQQKRRRKMAERNPPRHTDVINNKANKGKTVLDKRQHQTNLTTRKQKMLTVLGIFGSGHGAEQTKTREDEKKQVMFN